MKKNEKDVLKVIAETDTASPPPDATQLGKEIVLETKKSGFELPAGYLMAQEMKELFEEDIVTHVQGPSEPEGD
jgi:hypothetical protein